MITGFERKNSLLKQQGRLPSLHESQVWLGHPISTKEATTISFYRSSDSNLLIAGKQDEEALEMLITAMLSLVAQHSPAQAQFYVVDLSVRDMGAKYGGYGSPFELISQSLPEYFTRAKKIRSVV